MATIERRENPYSTRIESDRDVSRLCLKDREEALKLSGDYASETRMEQRRKPTLSPGVGEIIKHWRVSYGDF